MRLYYLDEWDAYEIVEVLTQDLFKDVQAFRLNGEAGQGRLSSALAQIRWPKYRTLPDKAAALHFFLSRDHPYVDGNKRFAVTAMDTFLYMNGAALMATDDEVTTFALSVASGALSFDGCAAFVRERTLRHGWGPARYQRWLAGISDDARPSIEAAWGQDGVPRRYDRIYFGIESIYGLFDPSGGAALDSENLTKTTATTETSSRAAGR